MEDFTVFFDKQKTQNEHTNALWIHDMPVKTK